MIVPPLRSLPFRWGAPIALLVLGLATIATSSTAMPGAVSAFTPGGHLLGANLRASAAPGATTSGQNQVRAFDDGGNDSGGGGWGGGNASQGSGNQSQVSNGSTPTGSGGAGGNSTGSSSSTGGGDPNAPNGTLLGSGDPSGSSPTSTAGLPTLGSSSASWTQTPAIAVLAGASVGGLLFTAGTLQRRLHPPPSSSRAPGVPKE